MHNDWRGNLVDHRVAPCAARARGTPKPPAVNTHRERNTESMSNWDEPAKAPDSAVTIKV